MIELAALERSGTFAAAEHRGVLELEAWVGVNEAAPGTSTVATH